MHRALRICAKVWHGGVPLKPHLTSCQAIWVALINGFGMKPQDHLRNLRPTTIQPPTPLDPLETSEVTLGCRYFWLIPGRCQGSRLKICVEQLHSHLCRWIARKQLVELVAHNSAPPECLLKEATELWLNQPHQRYMVVHNPFFGST